MDHSNKMLYQRLLLRAVLALLLSLFTFILLPQLIKLLFPFVLALIVAVTLNPVVNRINQKLGISRQIIAVLLDLLVFLIVASLISILVYSAVNEAVSLAGYIQLNWDDIAAKLDGWANSFDWLNNLLPSYGMDLLSNLEDNITTFLQNTGKDILSSVINAATAFTTKTGNFFVNFIMAILASYFMISDYNLIMPAAKKLAGKKTGTYFSIIKNSAVSALSSFLKSQLLLALFAFVFMFFALIIVKQPYALLIALFLGFIDLLPIVGTVAVLIPWGLLELAGGSTNKALYLLSIGIAFFLIRKVIEPKIVGSQTGLHPLAALLSTFIGLQFSGVWGAVLGPVVLMVIISIFKTGIFDNTISDINAVFNHISRILQSKESGPNQTTSNQPEGTIP